MYSSKLVNLLLFLLFIVQQVTAQAQNAVLVNHEQIEHFYQARVKTIDEMMSIFNGSVAAFGNDESNPNYRQSNIIALFSSALLQRLDSVDSSTEEAFVRRCVQSDVQIHYGDPSWYARAHCTGLYNKKNIKLDFLLKPEAVKPDAYRWCMTDVYGLEEAGMIDTTRWLGISPVEHEIGFVELIQFLNNNATQAVGLRSKESSIDRLSYFFGLQHEKKLTIQECESITYYFYNVPGFVFEVEEDNNTSSHSGWRIVSINRL